MGYIEEKIFNRNDGFHFYQVITASVVYAFLHITTVAIYRLYFHPLRDFPGPFLAKITQFYEFYYDCIRDGEMSTHAYNYLHPKYGSIVRIGPDKLRLSSPDDWFTIHSVGTKFYKDKYLYGSFGIDDGLLALTHNNEHRERRAMLNTLFSKASILRLEPLVWERTGCLLERVAKERGEASTKGEKYLFNGKSMFEAIIADITFDFAFGKPLNLLSLDPLEHEILDMTHTSIEGFPVGKFFPWMVKFMNALPKWLANLLLPGSAALASLKDSSFAEVKRLFSEKKAGTLKKTSNRITLFQELIEIYTSMSALSSDSLQVFAAGLNTTAWTLPTAFFYLGENKDVQDKLFLELKNVWPEKASSPPYEKLERLPYLTAFIKELLRLSHGVVGGVPRVVPEGGTTLSGRFVPAGTRVDSNVYPIHHNEDIFPNSFKFDPERWLQPDSKKKDKYVVAFGTGSRMCLGLHLAYMELYVITAAFVRNFEVDLTEELRQQGWRWADKWIPAIRSPAFFHLKDRPF